MPVLHGYASRVQKELWIHNEYVTALGMFWSNRLCTLSVLSWNTTACVVIDIIPINFICLVSNWSESDINLPFYLLLVSNTWMFFGLKCSWFNLFWIYFNYCGSIFLLSVDQKPVHKVDPGKLHRVYFVCIDFPCCLQLWF